MRWIKGLRPSPALVISVLALFVAISGLAVASFKLKPNSVKTKNVRNGAITREKIADGAVSGPKLADGAVTAGKLAMSFTVQLDGSTIPGNTCLGVGTPVPGVRSTDNVIVSSPPITPGLVPEGYAYDDHFLVRWCNVTTSPVGSSGPTWRVLVIR